jgi:hypothetical protein
LEAVDERLASGELVMQKLRIALGIRGQFPRIRKPYGAVEAVVANHLPDINSHGSLATTHLSRPRAGPSHE